MKHILIMFWVFFPIYTIAQNPINDREIVLNEVMERIIEQTESVTDFTEVRDHLENIMYNKLNLNTTDKSNFRKLIFLNELTTNAIINYRVKTGGFISIYELQSVDGIDAHTAYLLSYFVTVSDIHHQKQIIPDHMFRNGKQEISLMHENEFQQRAGFNKTLAGQGKDYYLGNPYRYALRYRNHQSDRFDIGFAGEKDMGEQFFNGAQKYGFDFNSGYLLLKNVSNFTSIILGDYHANFGQGLTFGSGLASRKSAYVMSVQRNFERIRPYHSLNESGFLRGAALSWSKRKVEVDGILSCKYISTNLSPSDSSTMDGFSTIDYTGYHRTASEISKMNNVFQTVAGSHLRLNEKRYEIGVTIVYTHFSEAFVPGSKPYQLYDFKGKDISSFGIDYRYSLGNVDFFGEISSGSSGGCAIISGVILPLHKVFDLMFLYRNYAKNYQSVFCNSFAENSDRRNEEGYYMAWTYAPGLNWVWNNYLDLHRSPWLRYLVDAPSHGTDLMSEIQFNPSKTVQIYARFHSEQKMHNISVDNSVLVSSMNRQNMRLNASYHLMPSLKSLTRYEWVQYSDLNGAKNGSVILQDVEYTPEGKIFSFTCRLAIFNIDDYNARLYESETDVPHQYAVPMYQNAGIRFYIVAKLHVIEKMDVYFKYAQTTYNNINVIGTGLQQINGNILSDLRLLLNMRF